MEQLFDFRISEITQFTRVAVSEEVQVIYLVLSILVKIGAPFISSV